MFISVLSSFQKYFYPVHILSTGSTSGEMKIRSIRFSKVLRIIDRNLEESSTLQSVLISVLV